MPSVSSLEKVMWPSASSMSSLDQVFYLHIYKPFLFAAHHILDTKISLNVLYLLDFLVRSTQEDSERATPSYNSVFLQDKLYGVFCCVSLLVV